ncbi:S8 family peptidase [Clostridium beijerinckii]|uniref:S8 family peptidase n=1 Tax=Clostridium beijerinckii TaxID=1520 RepID=UPI0004796E0F|nr:S8 family peptidase [Clostridium beijerinckii]
MKKIISTITVLLVAFGFTTNVNAAVVTSVSTPNERVIVVFKNKADKNIVSKARGNVRREYKNANVLSASVPTTAIKDLKDDPNILAVEPDVIVKANSQTVDWGVNKIQAPTAWASSYTGKGVKIGVVDTGIANHEDLLVSGGTAFTSYTTSYLDDNGHGTHVAGIIGAKNNGYGAVGVANEASLYAVKVLGSDGSGYLSDIIAGIDWCITNKMDIINLSLGSSMPSTALQQEVDKAYNQGIVVVAAAGNDGASDGTTDTVDYPAKYSSVIAVAAIDSNNKRPSFSSTGSTVEVAAPGVNILSTYLNNKYVYMSGTSMAAPFVTGDLALLKQANPGLSPSQLRAKLTENVIDLGTSGKDSWYGYGLIQAPKGQVSTVTQPVASQPVTTQPSKLETKTVVLTNKTSYLAGEIMYVKAKVTDASGKTMQGAVVKFTVTSPKDIVTVYKGMTDRYGEVFLGILTYRTTTKGTYKVLAETTYSGYMTSSYNTSFQIR